MTTPLWILLGWLAGCALFLGASWLESRSFRKSGFDRFADEAWSTGVFGCLMVTIGAAFVARWTGV